MKKVVAIAIVVIMTVALCTSVFADEPRLKVNKTKFTLGEPILVTATGSGADWIGFQKPEVTDRGCAAWVYVSTVGSGVEFDITKAENFAEYREPITEGKLVIALVANDAPWGDSSSWVESIEIEITAAGETATELKNKSWDNIYVNGEQKVNGKADEWLASNPISGEIDSLEVRGWAFISTTLNGFAYAIDGGTAVKSADFIQDRPDVQGAIDPTANGFDITIDVSNVGKGEHTIVIYAIDANDELVETGIELPFAQQKDAAAPSQPENPGTSDAVVIAVAAVACIALAGVVITKKVKI